MKGNSPFYFYSSRHVAASTTLFVADYTVPLLLEVLRCVFFSCSGKQKKNHSNSCVKYCTKTNQYFFLVLVCLLSVDTNITLTALLNAKTWQNVPVGNEYDKQWNMFLLFIQFCLCPWFFKLPKMGWHLGGFSSVPQLLSLDKKTRWT